MRLIPLRSSLLASVGYDPASETMVAQFQNGKFYEYRGVDAGVYLAIVTDKESHGKAFNQFVRNTKTPFESIEPEDVQRL